MQKLARASLALVLAIAGLALPARAGEWDGVAFEQPSPESLRCWLVLPTRLVPHDADIPFEKEPKLYTIRAGRNESESVQLVILSSKELQELTPQFTVFKSKTGSLPATIWKVNKIAEVPGKVAARAAAPIKTWPAHPAGNDPDAIAPDMYFASAASAVPDPLMPAESIDIDVGYTRLWLTVHIPEDAPPGEYMGKLRLTGLDGNITLFEIPMALRVWNYTLTGQTNLLVMADVQRDLARPQSTTKPSAAATQPATAQAATWDQLRPYYDELHAHGINATGEINPPALWTRGEEPPDYTAYEASLKYVLDDLHFARFRFPAGGPWKEQTVFEPAGAFAAADSVWIDTIPNNVEGQATLANFASIDHPGEFNFENTCPDPLWIWLQVDTHTSGAARTKGVRSVYIDGNKAGETSVSQFLADGVGFAFVPAPVTLTPGKHRIRVDAENTTAADETLAAIFITPLQDPDFDQVLRSRATLSKQFTGGMQYHVQQAGLWLKQHGWLKKAQFDIEGQLPRDDDYGHRALLQDWVANLLPTVRRESHAAPSFATRKQTEVWMPDLSAANFDPDEWAKVLQPGQELWATHTRLQTVGYPPLAMRVLPLLVARHEFTGLSLGVINNPRCPLLYSDAATGEPIGSVRFDLFRDGLEDYETFGLLRVAVDDAIGRNEKDARKVKAIELSQKLFEDQIPSLVKNAREFSWNPVAYSRVREDAGELLNVLSAE